MSNWNNEFVKEGLTFDDVLLVPIESHVLPNDVDLKVELISSLKLNLPFISVGMDTVTEHGMTIVMVQVGGLDIIHKDMTTTNQASKVKFVRNAEVISEKAAADNKHRLLVAAAVGVTTDTFERVSALIDAGANAIVIDTVHGHPVGVLRKISEVRARFPNIDLIAGNTATAVGIRAPYDAGVDVVEVGAGSGSICTVRVVAGAGVPQIIATYDTANVAREYGKIITADDGIKYSGGIVKVLAAGGNTVTLGSMFFGAYETPGQAFENQGQKFKAYRGMGSTGAMSQAHGSSDRYFQGDVNKANKLVSEGVEVYAAYKGYVKNVTFQLIDGLRAGIGYVGAPDLVVLVENVQFICTANTGLVGSHPHDVQATKQAPNYQG